MVRMVSSTATPAEMIKPILRKGLSFFLRNFTEVPVAQNVNNEEDYYYHSEEEDEDEEQTHHKTSRFRKVATLFVLSLGTLGDLVAPEH